MVEYHVYIQCTSFSTEAAPFFENPSRDKHLESERYSVNLHAKMGLYMMNVREKCHRQSFNLSYLSSILNW